MCRRRFPQLGSPEWAINHGLARVSHFQCQIMSLISISQPRAEVKSTPLQLVSIIVRACKPRWKMRHFGCDPRLLLINISLMTSSLAVFFPFGSIVAEERENHLFARCFEFRFLEFQIRKIEFTLARLCSVAENRITSPWKRISRVSQLRKQNQRRHCHTKFHLTRSSRNSDLGQLGKVMINMFRNFSLLRNNLDSWEEENKQTINY